MKIADSIKEKIKEGKYKFKKRSCFICGNNEFKLIAEKDRDSLPFKVGICNKCGFVQSYKALDQDSLNKFYNEEYRRLKLEKPHADNDFFNKQMLRGKKIRKFLKDYFGGILIRNKIVEIGTGAGGILNVFKEDGNNVYGFDLGEEYINFGKSKGLDLDVGGLELLKKFNRNIDLIILSDVLEHIDNPLEYMKSLKEYINKETYIYIKVPGIFNIHKTYCGDFNSYLDFSHLSHFTLNSLRELMRKAGYKLLYADEEVNALFQIGRVKKFYLNEELDIRKYLIKQEYSFNYRMFLFRMKVMFIKFLEKIKIKDSLKRIKEGWLFEGILLNEKEVKQ